MSAAVKPLRKVSRVLYLVVAVDWNWFKKTNSQDKVIYTGAPHRGRLELALSHQRNKLAGCWWVSAAAAYKRADSQPAFWAATLDIQAALSVDVR